MEAQNQIQRNFQIMTVFMHARDSKAPYHRMRVKGVKIDLDIGLYPVHRVAGVALIYTTDIFYFKYHFVSYQINYCS